MPDALFYEEWGKIFTYKSSTWPFDLDCRVEHLPRETWTLEAYRRVGIILGPFPYPGGTTSVVRAAKEPWHRDTLKLLLLVYPLSRSSGSNAL